MLRSIWKNKLVMLCLASVCIVGSAAGGALAARAGKSHHASLRVPKARSASSFATITPGPYPFTRANGLNPANAQSAGTSSVVGELKIVRGNGVACVLHEEDDHCISEELISQGRDVSVHTGCGSSDRTMAIYGVAPPQTTTVRISWTDGSSTEAELNNDVYVYDGTTPSGSGPYPTSLTWVGSSGATNTPFPLKPNQFCPEG
ncbi:MAG: hypothetical protein ACLP1Q_01370 [Solirubrobacteraceae bacterium]|jgi:hypothetical protein